MNTGNRVLWSVIGLVLLAAGLLGVMANRGWLPFVDSDQPALNAAGVARWNSWGDWPTAVIIAAGLVLILLGFLLLRAQLRGRGGAAMGDLSVRRTVPRDDSVPREGAVQREDATAPNATPSATPSTETAPVEAGRTQVASSALSHALTRDLEGGREVRQAVVRIVGKPARPQLLVRLSVTQDADLAGLKGHVDRAVGRFATTSGLSPEVAEVTVRVADREPARVQ